MLRAPESGISCGSTEAALDFFSRVVKTAFIDSEAYSYPPPGKAQPQPWHAQTNHRLSCFDRGAAHGPRPRARRVRSDRRPGAHTRAAAAAARQRQQMLATIPEEAVSKMLALADVRKRDLVCDLEARLRRRSNRNRSGKISFEKGHALEISNRLGPGRFADRKISRFASRPPVQVRCHCLRDLR